jgi:hypothetical protein
MSKGWHTDQNVALGKRFDLRHYGENGTLRTPSISQTFLCRSAGLIAR